MIIITDLIVMVSSCSSPLLLAAYGPAPPSVSPPTARTSAFASAAVAVVVTSSPSPTMRQTTVEEMESGTHDDWKRVIFINLPYKSHLLYVSSAYLSGKKWIA
jgi:hypothetical protein